MKQEEQFLNIQVKESQVVVDKEYIDNLNNKIYFLKKSLNELIRYITKTQDILNEAYEMKK